ILLLEEGEVAHYGSHELLLRESPQYRELYELQFGRQKEPVTSEAIVDGKNGQIEAHGVATFVVAPSGAA
ncbi:hypothetical protein HUU40_17665, partial [candidate division KSB1 bacterium]|nr:hypothetical protein [candidate division KSB1 bacterium]